MGYVRDMTIDGLMENKPQLLWASHYLSALAKALMDDAELGNDALSFGLPGLAYSWARPLPQCAPSISLAGSAPGRSSLVLRRRH
ncbi:hypothetical protein ABIB24_003505 [Pseudomonas sp. UYEF17]